MADNSFANSNSTPAINEPSKETKLKSDSKFLTRKYYQIYSPIHCGENSIFGTDNQFIFDFDVKRFLRKIHEFNHVLTPASNQYQLPKKLLAAVIQVESNWDINAKSIKKAKGLMQLMPITQKETLINNPYNPQQNIKGGAQHLKLMCDKFGSLELGLVAYKIGQTKLRMILNKKQRYKIPPSAIKYTQKIIYLYKNA